MIRVDLEWSPRGDNVTVEELLLEMPIRPEHARYLYHFPGQWGSVANSGFLPADGWSHAFKPFVWLGDEDRGLAWFCESDENWSPADPNRALTIDARDDRVVFCCHLIERPTVLAGPLKYTFGFQATPVKNPEKTVWDYRITHSGNYGLERQPAQGPDTPITYPAAGHVRAEEGTFECWYRPAYDTERELPVEQRKHMANRSLFTIKWGPDIQAGHELRLLLERAGARTGRLVAQGGQGPAEPRRPVRLEGRPMASSGPDLERQDPHLRGWQDALRELRTPASFRRRSTRP